MISQKNNNSSNNTHHYILFKFRNAKVFNNKPRRTKDRISVQGVTEERKTFDYFEEVINVNQISNMLHVLFSERPVPSLRGGFVQKVNNNILDIAKNSYIKIDNLKRKNFDKTKVNETPYFGELVRTKKSVYNSYVKTTTETISWQIFETYINDKDNTEKVIALLNDLLQVPNVKKYTVSDVIVMVNKTPKEKRLEFYNNITAIGGLSGIIYFFGRYVNNMFEEPRGESLTNQYTKPSSNTVISGIETNVMCLSGSIISKVSGDELEKLKQCSRGCATILDGGLIWIDDIVSDVSADDYIKVSELSTKTNSIL